MKTKSERTNKQIWLGMAAGFALLLLIGTPQTILGQQWTTNGNNISNTNSGNVGIGTASPIAKLGMQYGSDYTSGIHIGQGSAATGLSIWHNDASLTSSYIESRYDNAGSAMYFRMRAYGTPVNALTLLGSGNVGIGTTDPSTPLSAGGWSNSGLTIGNGSASAGVVLHSSGSSPLSSLRFATGASGLYDQGFVLYNHNANFMSFGTNRGTRMTIDSSGNVGIGTTSPSQKLQVNAGAIYVTQAAGSDCLMFDHAGVNTWRTRITTDNTSSYIIGNDIGGTFNTKVLTLAQGGNVGIGTTSPTEKLHVAGNGKITGNLTVDGNIAAKYQDVAEWVPASEQIPFGTVVVLDPTKSNHVIQSTQSYDTRVAGVISAQPGIALGESAPAKSWSQLPAGSG